MCYRMKFCWVDVCVLETYVSDLIVLILKTLLDKKLKKANKKYIMFSLMCFKSYFFFIR